MEESIVFDQPSSNCNCDDIYPPEHLPIPPLDYPLLTDDLSFPDNLPFTQPSDADLEFTIEDLEFIDDLLSDPDPGSPDRTPSPSQPLPVAHSDTISVSGERWSSEADCNLEIIEDSEPPRAFVAEHAKREHESSGHVSSQGSGNGERKSDCQSPESGSCDQFSSHGSGVSPVEIPRSPDSCQSSPHFSSSLNVPALKAENLATNGLAESRVKIEENVTASKFTPKRKKEHQDEGSAETRTSKFRKSSEAMENASVDLSLKSDDDDKKKARLMRNRESAQLSRQRKKQYVEELEDKVKSMHSTITELNSKMSYIIAENATLRQQLSGGGLCPPPPPPGMYPMAPMGYPWMPCPPYVVKPQGSQVPLVPIPRLKPQKPASVPRVSKKADKLESKKEVGKTKKVASISFLGLLFFMLLFGGLVPIVNVKYGGKLSVPDEFSKAHNGRILMVDGRSNETSGDGGSARLDRKHGHESGHFKGKHCGTSVGKKEHPTQFGTGANGSVPVGNSSEPLAASLYVPRNDKLVKIDGNLIIHSVLASERAVTSHGTVQTKTSEETRLAIARNYAPSYHAAGAGQSNTRGSQLDDGKLQEWFREDLSGSLLRSGMCTEVFQFDVTPTPGSIVPATPMTNTTDQRKNSPNKGRNRRFLSGYPIPLDLHALNVTNEHVRPNAEKGRLRGDNSSSSIVVSVLVDPREADEIDSEGVRKSKSLSRIFVVVLIDSVKYVTYSCMLPLMGGSGLHLVTN